MHLRELRLILRKHLAIAFAVLFVCVTAGAAAALLPQPIYRTSATVIVGVRNDDATGRGAILRANFALPAIEEKVKSRQLRADARERVSPENQDRRVNVTPTVEGSVLRITGTSESAAAAQEWVNAISRQLIRDERDDGPVVLALLDPAPLKRIPASTRAVSTFGSFLAMGLLAAVIAAVIADRVRRSSETAEMVHEHLHVPVVGLLPARRRRGVHQPITQYLQEARLRRPRVLAAFESTAGALEFAMRQAEIRSVCVVSTTRINDSSAAVAGLGLTIAATGRDVSIIDADSQSRRLSEQLGIARGAPIPNVSDSGSTRVNPGASAHHRLEIYELGGPSARSQANRQRASAAVQDIVDSGRVVLVDGGPLLGSDAAVAGITVARDVVLLLDDRSVQTSVLDEAEAKIYAAGGRLLGVIIDDVPARKMSGEVGRHELSDQFVAEQAGQR